MSTKQMPKSGKIKPAEIDKSTGTLYYTIGTQDHTPEGEFFINEEIVKKSYNDSVVEILETQGKVVILRGDVLADFLADGFSFIDDNDASSNSRRKLKESEAAKAEVERKNAELEARLAAFETAATKAIKTKGGSNA